jgi:uncharacterized membrane protein
MNTARRRASSPECCLSLPPGQNRSKLLLRDGVCRGGNAREFHQTQSSDIVIERQTLQGLRTTVNLSQMDAAPLGLQMFLVLGSSGRERQKLGVLAKAR